MKNFTRSRFIGTLLIVLVVLGVAAPSVDFGSAAPVPQVRLSMPGPRVIRLHDDRYIPHHVPPPVQVGSGIRTATFAVNWNPAGCPGTVSPWPQDAIDAFNYAVGIWSSLLNSSEVIVVDACWQSDLPSNYLGQAGPTTIRRDFPSAPTASTWYAAALANTLENGDLNDADGWDSDGDGNDVDSEVGGEFNSTFDWYYGTDGNTPGDKVDFVTLVLHELGHGLGFSGSAAVDTGDNACGTGTPGDGCVGWVGYPFAYDRFTEDGNGTALLNYTSPSGALRNALTGQVGGGVYFSGTTANAANGNSPVELYSPNPWVPGSSYSHLGVSFNGTPNSLMTYSQGNGVSEHNPGPVTLGMLGDMGWAAANTAPNISNLPDRIVDVNGTADNTIDLWAYAGDAQTPVSELAFSIANAPNPNAGITIDSNRYIDITPAADWSGETDVTIRVTDLQGMQDTDTFLVRVTELFSIHLPLVLRGWMAQPPDWVTIVSEDFEGTFPGSTWEVLDENGAGGLYYWGRRDCRSNDSSFSVWSVGAGDTTLGCGSDYPNDVTAWMVYGPFSLADATAAELTFDWWSWTEQDNDYFFWGASLDDSTYWGPRVSGDWSGWTTGERLDLSAVPTLGNLLGEDQVWIAFTFRSDPGVTEEGSYVDNVLLRKQIGTVANGSERPVSPPRTLESNQTMEFVGLRLNR